MTHLYPLVPLEAIKAPSRYSMVGGPFGSKLVSRDYRPDGVPVIRGGNLASEGRFSCEDFVFVTEEKVTADLFGNLAFPGDIVVTQRGTLGQVGLIPNSSPYRRFVVSQSQMKLTVDASKADPLFVYYGLKSPIGQHEIQSRAITAGVPHINLSLFQQLRLPLPQLTAQRKIAAILSAYDDLIEINNRRIKILEEMAQRIYHEWFVDFRYPGHEDVPVVDSELGRIPKSWPVVPLSDVTSTQYGYTESATDEPVGPRFLRGKDINKTSYVDWATVPFCPIDALDRAKYRLAPGDVVIIRMADPGKVGIVEADIEAVFASYLIRIQPRDHAITPYFLFYFLSSDRYQAFVSGASTGTTRKSLSAPLITSAHLAVPPPATQAAFVDAVAPLREHLNVLVGTNATLRATRDLLLPRLISGDVDVTDLRISEPELAA